MTVRRILAALALLVTGLVAAPADAVPEAAKRPFRQTFTCGLADYDSPSGVWVFVGAGHYTDSRGNVSRACGYNHRKWHPSVHDYTATVRWYAGKKLMATEVRPVHNKFGKSRAFTFYHPALRGKPSTDLWTLNGKRVRVTVTFTKKGYAPVVHTRLKFPDED